MKRPKTGNTADILEAVWMHEGISRIDLAKLLDIDKSTVSNIVGDLIDRGLVEEYDQATASSLGGRKPVKLRLNRSFGAVVGVEVQPDFTRLVVVDLKGTKVYTRTWVEATDGAGLVDRFRQALAALAEDRRDLFERCLGAGLAVSGIVDPFQGRVLRSISLGLTNAEVGPALGRGYPFPVFVENDANAACWGEVVIGQNLRSNLRSFLFCLVEFHERGPGWSQTGGSIGLGFVINGQIHTGENFSAGEFQSVAWRPGNTFQFSLNDDEMARLRGDPELLGRFSRELADHMVLLSRVFNLNHVTFGGAAEAFRGPLEAAMAAAQARVWPGGDSPCVVGFSTEGNDAVAYGAACLGLTRFFRDSGSLERLATLPVFR